MRPVGATTAWTPSPFWTLKSKKSQLKGSSLLIAHCVIVSRISWFSMSNGIAPFLDFQLSFIVSYVHAALGRPTRRFSVVLGISVLVAKVTWCCGWSRDRRMICPNNFFRFSCNTSLRGRMYLFCAEPIASFARLKTSSFVFARSIYVVVMFKIFLSPFSWNVSSLLAVASVGWSASRL